MTVVHLRLSYLELTQLCRHLRGSGSRREFTFQLSHIFDPEPCLHMSGILFLSFDWRKGSRTFFLKIFVGHMSIFWAHWYPCFGLLVKSPLGFKAIDSGSGFPLFRTDKIPWLFPDFSSLFKIPWLFPDWKMPSHVGAALFELCGGVRDIRGSRTLYTPLNSEWQRLTFAVIKP